MAVIKSIAPGKSLARILNYVDKKAVARSGKDCSDDAHEAREDMNAIKESFGKEEGRIYSHVVQSFALGEITPERAHEIGREYTDRVFKNFQVYIATHALPGKPVHNHFVINSVSHVDGRKFQLGKPDLERLKRENDRICKEQDISIPEKGSSGNLTTFDGNLYRLLKHIKNNDFRKDGRGYKSFVLDAALAVSGALKSKPRTREEFIAGMENRGYTVLWRDELKHITYTDPEGNKIRASNLLKIFQHPLFEKENMEKVFHENAARAGLNQVPPAPVKEKAGQRISPKEILSMRAFLKAKKGAERAPEGYIDKMEQAGFIKVERTSNDPKDWDVEVTEKGTEQIRKVVRMIQQER